MNCRKQLKKLIKNYSSPYYNTIHKTIPSPTHTLNRKHKHTQKDFKIVQNQKNELNNDIWN